MNRTRILAFALFILALIGFCTPAQARGGDPGAGYSQYHRHYNTCGGAYAAKYKRRRPHYYRVNVRPGRYAWRTRRIRVGTIRRRGRVVPAYRTVRQRYLVRPVRYRVTRHRAYRRWTTKPVVIKGRTRWRRSYC